MRITVIGSGNVATHLAKQLFARDYQIDAVISKNIGNAQDLADQVNAEAFDNLKKFDGWSKTDLVLVAIKDDAIDEVISSGILKHNFVVHTSGSYNSNQMESHCKYFGAFYPFQTFRKSAIVDITEVPFFLEVNDDSKYKELEKLAIALSGKVTPMNSEARKKLHLSGVFINNFIYFILDKTKNLCLANKIEIETLRPLLNQTIDYALSYPDNLQTGPAKRGDVETIKGHMELLADNPYLSEIYLKLTNLIHKETNGEEIEL